MQLCDEQLMAYADGRLPEDEAESVRAQLDKDPEAARRVELFRQSTLLLQRAYGPIAEEAPPRTLLDRIASLSSPPAEADAAAAGERESPERRWSWISWIGPLLFPAPARFALYGLLLCLGLFGGWMGGRHSGEVRTAGLALPQDAALSHGLETHLSGATFAVASAGVEITPTLSFLSDGRYCRQFEIRSPGYKAAMSKGIACRAAEGEWQTIAVFTAAPEHGNQEHYAPAGTRDIGAAILDEYMDAAPLSLEEEKKRVHEQWRVTP
jgi:hypothetical protein